MCVKRKLIGFCKSFIISVLICLWLVAATSEASVASQWSDYEVVPNSTQFSMFSRTAAAVDSSGYLHVLYAEADVLDLDELYHQWYDGSEWHVETIDDATYGQYSFSLGIDSTDTLHVCYINDQERVKYAWGTPGAWSYATIDLDSHSCTKPMLAIDDNDDVHIAYMVGGNYNLRYSSNASGTWQSSTAVHESYPNIRLYRLLCNAQNQPVICYQVLNEYKYAVYNAGLWALNDAITSTAYRSDAAMDSNGNIHLCFYGYDSGTNLNYATNAGGPWSSEVVDTGLLPVAVVGCETPAIIVDGTDTIHIFYREQDGSGNKSLRSVYGQSGSWTYETLAVMYANMVASPVLDLAGQCELVAYSQMLHGIEHFKKEGVNWTRDIVANTVTIDGPTTIVVDPNDDVHIFHFDYMTGYLQATSFDRVTRRSATLSAFSEGSMPQSHACDAAIDSTGARHVLLTGEDFGSLSHWTDGSGLWESSSVYPDKSSGYSLALSPSDTVYAAYYDVFHESYCLDPDFPLLGGWEWDETHELHISSLVGSLWQTQATVPAQVFASHACSDVCVDASGKVHCVYIDSFDNGVSFIYLSNITGSWEYEMVDPNVADRFDGIRGFISIDVDSGGNPHVVYVYENELKYACKQGGVWSYETLTSNTDKIVRRCIIELDSSDNICICYYDAVAQAVMVARGSIGAWSHETVVDGCGDFSGLWSIFTDSLAHLGGQPSMAVDSAGKVHISYYKAEETYESLKIDGTIHYVTNAFLKPGISVNREYMYWFVEKDSTAQTTVTVTSTGSGALTILSIDVTGADASKFSISDDYTTPLSPGQECVITVEFDTSSEGTYEATLNIENNDPAIPIVSIPLTVRCYVVPSSSLFCKVTSFDFGSVVEGTSSADLSVRVSNNGDTHLDLQVIAVDDEINYVCENLKFPVPLNPGDSYETWVRFSPQATGRFDTVLHFAASGTPSASTSVQLTGLGIPAPKPDISVNPFGYDFGEVQQTASSLPMVFSIYNYGDADLVISELSVTDVNYTVDPNMGKWPIGPDLPATVLPKQAVMFGLTFHPPAIGQFDTTVKIFSNDPDLDEYKLYMPVTGQGYHWNLCDFDIDGDVDLGDFAILANHWLGKVEGWPPDVAPAPLDGSINLFDLYAFAENWLESL